MEYEGIKQKGEKILESQQNKYWACGEVENLSELKVLAFVAKFEFVASIVNEKREQLDVNIYSETYSNHVVNMLY